MFVSNMLKKCANLISNNESAKVTSKKDTETQVSQPPISMQSSSDNKENILSLKDPTETSNVSPLTSTEQQTSTSQIHLDLSSGRVDSPPSEISIDFQGIDLQSLLTDDDSFDNETNVPSTHSLLKLLETVSHIPIEETTIDSRILKEKVQNQNIKGITTDDTFILFSPSPKNVKDDSQHSELPLLLEELPASPRRSLVQEETKGQSSPTLVSSNTSEGESARFIPVNQNLDGDCGTLAQDETESFLLEDLEMQVSRSPQDQIVGSQMIHVEGTTQDQPTPKLVEKSFSPNITMTKSFEGVKPEQSTLKLGEEILPVTTLSEGKTPDRPIPNLVEEMFSPNVTVTKSFEDVTPDQSTLKLGEKISPVTTLSEGKTPDRPIPKLVVEERFSPNVTMTKSFEDVTPDQSALKLEEEILPVTTLSECRTPDRPTPNLVKETFSPNVTVTKSFEDVTPDQSAPKLEDEILPVTTLSEGRTPDRPTPNLVEEKFSPNVTVTILSDDVTPDQPNSNLEEGILPVITSSEGKTPDRPTPKLVEERFSPNIPGTTSFEGATLDQCTRKLEEGIFPVTAPSEGRTPDRTTPNVVEIVVTNVTVASSSESAAPDQRTPNLVEEGNRTISPVENESEKGNGFNFPVTVPIRGVVDVENALMYFSPSRIKGDTASFPEKSKFSQRRSMDQTITAGVKGRDSLLFGFDPLYTYPQKNPLKEDLSQDEKIHTKSTDENVSPIRRSIEGISETAEEVIFEVLEQALNTVSTSKFRDNRIFISGRAMADVTDKLALQEGENAELRLQLNASQQVRATLELQLRQKEEIIIKSQAESLRKDQAFKIEVKQLKEKLEEKSLENENSQAKDLQDLVKTLKSRETKLISELNARKNDEQNYRKVMDEYEKTIAAQLAELQKLNEEHETVKRHLANLELAFSDVHQKYERSKKIIDGYKNNEQTLRDTLASTEDTVIKSEEKYESLKAHAKAQINKSNQEMQITQDQYNAEIHKLSAIIRRLEIKNASLTDSLDQKIKECSALATLCDEVTGKV